MTGEGGRRFGKGVGDRGEAGRVSWLANATGNHPPSSCGRAVKEDERHKGKGNSDEPCFDFEDPDLFFFSRKDLSVHGSKFISRMFSDGLMSA